MKSYLIHSFGSLKKLKDLKADYRSLRLKIQFTFSKGQSFLFFRPERENETRLINQKGSKSKRS